MGKNNINNKSVNESIIATLAEPEVLNSMTKENQKVVINTVKEAYNHEKEGGTLGKVLGTNKTNASMHIAFILCILLLIVGLVIRDNSIWDKIITLIAAALGYIFGITQKEN